MFSLGIDIGSTTAKVVLLDAYHDVLFSEYVRHNARILESLVPVLTRLFQERGNLKLRLSLTGTAGMGLAERAKLPFVQEVVAAGLVVQAIYPQVRTLIDIGGEDGKIILFDQASDGSGFLRPTIRMNGNCAGGTGSFIDQMAGLLGLDVSQLSDLAASSTQNYPMASRCGVFAKTDVQTLMSRSVPRADIVASVYRAVAFQTVSSLAHGADLHAKVLFAGGPLGFQAGLRQAFCEVLKIDPADTLLPPRPELVPAIGAALNNSGREMQLQELLSMLATSAGIKLKLTPSLSQLFESNEHFEAWMQEKASHQVARASLSSDNAAANRIFLGIDCGSRTSKLVLIDDQGRLLASFYRGNDGDPLQTVNDGLETISVQLEQSGLDAKVALKAAASTGYSEELLQHAFLLDYGIVETLAHFRAAREWDEQVSFILDIGGQDMKAIFVDHGVIQHMELNEACSSGTGSFIEGFALGLGVTLEDFALQACCAKEPRDLGTRCTVFMNSKVKQALREGAELGDISAGLAYSVVKNCFQKVLKIHDPRVIGQHIIAQGGTFKNPAVLRALELHVGSTVIRPDIAELMGAYGAALLARDRWIAGGQVGSSTFIGFDCLLQALPLVRKNLSCQGCENLCTVTRMDFEGGHHFYTGHKCNKVFNNTRSAPSGQSVSAARLSSAAPSAEPGDKAFDMLELKRRLLFDRALRPTSSDGKSLTPRARIGIPRVLNLYEDFPFWATLFVEAGFEVCLSSPSSLPQVEQGYSTVMSENICFPAKLANGHILELCQWGVDRIFFPMIRHDRQEFKDSLNSFNCPVVTGYPEVIRSAIDPERNFGIAFDAPAMSFKHPDLMKKACQDYLSGLGVDKKTSSRAWGKAEAAWHDYRKTLCQLGLEAREKAQKEGRLGILLLSRPYHVDALVNHKVPEMITSFGVDVYTDDIVDSDQRSNLPGVQVLTQWAFPNRFYDAALWAADQSQLEVVQLNSFGCGPDAMSVDEVRSLLREKGKNPTLLRIDEVSSPGSLRLRIRSLIDSVRERPDDFRARAQTRSTTPVFTDLDRTRTIIAPMFSPFYTEFIVSSFKSQGYKIVVLPMSDWQSVQKGLSYTNHDICYPATIIIGDIIKALQSGQYDPQQTAVAITQTGGQCRASSYVSLLKKALVAAGLGQVPVVTLSTGTSAGKPGGLNQQPGFKMGPIKLGLEAFFGILFADVLAKLYYASSLRETLPGSAWELVEAWIAKAVAHMAKRGPWTVLSLLPDVLASFEQVLENHKVYPKVGIVGEIFVKFNPFANNYLSDWLRDRKLEPDVPPLINFFLQKLVTDEFNKEHHIEKRSTLAVALLGLGEKAVNHYLERVNRHLSSFSLPITPFHTMQDLANGAQKVLSLINQYGESWLIAGDIAGFSESGTNHVVCLQPFGCIANHIIAKGVEKRLKQTYPHLSILFLDMDAGSSEVNLSNRLEFLARSAWQDFERSQTEQGSTKTHKV